jgi:regulatory protein YycI of two-component signal transduction system YycFG
MEKINFTKEVGKQMKIRKEPNIPKTTKMTEITTYFSIITLNVTGLYSPVWCIGLKNKTQQFVTYKKHISLTKTLI